MTCNPQKINLDSLNSIKDIEKLICDEIDAVTNSDTSHLNSQHLLQLYFSKVEMMKQQALGALLKSTGPFGY